MKRFRPAIWPLVGLVAVTVAILLLAPAVAQEKHPVGPVDRALANAKSTSNAPPLPAPVA